MFERGTLEKTSPELWENTLAINLRAPFFLSQAFAAQTEKGDIVFLTDSRVRRPTVEFLAYTLTKSALVTLTRSLAKSLAPRIRVNAVAPGAILPPPGEGEGYLQRLIPRIPLKRPGSPDDIVRGIAYLLEHPSSPASPAHRRRRVSLAAFDVEHEGKPEGHEVILFFF